MPKTRGDRPISFRRSRKSPLACSSGLNSESKQPSSNPSETEDLKEWEESRCPVCIEHPHNAVLLVCSAYHKGCRPYMCDTSYRHSNCLDQFRKSFASTFTEENAEPVISTTSTHEEVKTTPPILASMHKLEDKLVCPLCRGQVSGWIVVDPARDFMNAKRRSCACEACDFTGNYADLRKHARHQHPQVKPCVANPERQRNWRQLERERDIGDVISTIQSSFGEDHQDGDDDGILPMDERGWITIFFLFRVSRPSSSLRSSSSWSGTSRARTRTRAQHGGARRRSTRLWGESYDVEHGSLSVEDYESSDGWSIVRRPRVRRRLSTPDDEI